MFDVLYILRHFLSDYCIHYLKVDAILKHVKANSGLMTAIRNLANARYQNLFLWEFGTVSFLYFLYFEQLQIAEIS